MTREVSCPRCGKRHVWEGNPFRPFCSERCKLIDFGGWLDERHAIPGEPAEIPDEDSPAEGDVHLQRQDRNH